jgi:hypothetical protein
MRQRSRTQETDERSNWQVFRLELHPTCARADQASSNESAHSHGATPQLLEPQADLDLG